MPQPVIFGTNNAERMRISAAGNVGIGAIVPAYKLHVVGQDVRVEGNAPNIFPRFSLNFIGGNTDEKRWQNYAGPNALNFTSLNDAENAETFWLRVNRGAGTTISSIVLPNGNVGIGSIMPNAKLDVAGDTRVSSNLTVDTNTLFVDATNHRVGIGTLSPFAKLSVVAAGSNEIIGAAQSSTFRTTAGTLGNNAGDEISLASIGFLNGNNTSLGIRGRRITSGTGWPTTAIGLGMDVDDTVRAGDATLWLHANGNVGIGQSNPTAKLTVEGTVQSNSGGFKFPDGSVQTTAAASTTYTTARNNSVHISEDATPASILHLDLPMGTYLLSATVDFFNETQGLINNARTMYCTFPPDGLTYASTIAGQSHLTTTFHSVFISSGSGGVDLQCARFLDSGNSMIQNINANFRRLTAVKIEGNVVAQ